MWTGLRSTGLFVCVMGLAACPSGGGDEQTTTSAGSSETGATGSTGTPPGSTGDTASAGITTNADTTDGDSGSETGPPPLPETCDIFAQDCPEGFKCTFAVDPKQGNDYNTLVCVPVVEEPNGPQQTCTVSQWPPDGNDDCDDASFCFNVDMETLEGICYAFCIGDFKSPTCANECEYCAITGDGILLPCLPTCDPLAPDCPPDQVCVPANDSFTCAPDLSMGAAVGDECEFVNTCPAGSACINSNAVPDCGGAGCCSPFCDPAAAMDPCPGQVPGTECLPWYEEEPPMPECVTAPPGVCGIPQ